MNGKIGIVEGPDGIRPGIFKVKLEETGKVVGIRKMNMDFLERHVEEEESEQEPPPPETPEEPMPDDEELAEQLGLNELDKKLEKLDKSSDEEEDE